MAKNMATTSVGGVKISSRNLTNLKAAADSEFAKAINLLSGPRATFGDTVIDISKGLHQQSDRARDVLLRSFDSDFLSRNLGSDPAGILQLGRRGTLGCEGGTQYFSCAPGSLSCSECR